MFKKMSIVVVLVLCLTGIAVAQSVTTPQKIRAAYWGICPPEQGEHQLQMLQQHGLNMALINDSGYTVKTDIWAGWGKLADTYAVHVCPIHSFAGTKEVELLKGQFHPYVDRAGRTLPSTPCPLDANYWNGSIVERFEQFAQLSKSATLFAALFDTEMYGTELSIYRDPCFCDICWREFVQSVALQDQAAYQLGPEERAAYLTRHHLFDQYAAEQENRLQDIVSRIEQYIHALNPNLQLGFLAYANNWFYRGLIRGLGTAHNPALVFSETSYVRGYTPYVDRERRAIEDETMPEEHTTPIARYIPGIWLGRFYADDLPSQLYQTAAHNSSGYWLFTASSLWMEGEKPDPYALHGSNADYWAAFKQANAELDRLAQTPSTYHSVLSPVYPSSFYDSAQNHLSTPPSLPAFLGKAANHQPSSSPKGAETLVTYRGTTLFHGLKQTPTASIRITHVSLGYADATHYTLFDSQGMVVEKGVLDDHTPSVTIPLSPQVSGLVSVLTESGINATQIEFSGLPYLVEASATFPAYPVNTISTYTIYVSPEQHHLQLYAYCSATQAAALTVQSPDQRVNQITEIRQHTEIRVPVPVETVSDRTPEPNPQLSLQLDSGHAIPLNAEHSTNNQHFWTIAIAPLPSEPYEMIELYLYNAEFPYILIW